MVEPHSGLSLSILQVTKREDGTFAQEVQYEKSSEEVSTAKKSRGVVSKITAFATTCFTGGSEISRPEKAGESR